MSQGGSDKMSPNKEILDKEELDKDNKEIYKEICVYLNEKINTNYNEFSIIFG